MRLTDKCCNSCVKKGRLTNLRLYQINLRSAVYMCPLSDCTYLADEPIIYVPNEIEVEDDEPVTKRTKFRDDDALAYFNPDPDTELMRRAVLLVEMMQMLERSRPLHENAAVYEGSSRLFDDFLRPKFQFLCSTQNGPDLDDLIRSALNRITARLLADPLSELPFIDDLSLHTLLRSIIPLHPL